MPDRVSLMEAALDVYPEGLALLDGDERVVLWNRAAEQMTGHPGAEVVGRRLPEALEPLAQGRHCEMQSWDAGR
jgi:PAS domain S-box-containing protein